MDKDRILRPLVEREDAIEALETYASAGELADAITSVQAALEQAVRLLLRADDGAPEDARMSALSEATPLDAVVTALRRRDRVSMQLAGRLHQAERTAARIAGGDGARPADADVIRAAVDLFRSEIAAEPAVPPPELDSEANAPPHGAGAGLEEPPFAAEPEEQGRGALAFAIGAALLIVVVLSAVLLLRDGSAAVREDAIAAFEVGDYAAARRGFQALLGQDSADVTALLYLARIHRREEQPAEAASALQTAVAREPADADVLRELGWLFLDLNRPQQAAQQFERARDLKPDDARNWIGLVHALRRAGDPRAESVLRDAPADARAVLGRPGA